MAGHQELHTVPVAGGDLTFAVWSPALFPNAAVVSEGSSGTPGTHAGMPRTPDTSDSPRPVVAIHGITGTHAAWPFLAQALPDRPVIAPDLRGRGRSRDLPGPFGLAQHADDVADLIRHVAGGVEGTAGPVDVVGHSMGGSIAAVLAHRHPDLVANLVLVDGGLPFAPAELESTKAGLDLIKARLAATFGDPAAYIDLFRNHPAFGSDWSAEAEAYAAYDVIEREPGTFGASAQPDAVVADQVDIIEGSALSEALAALKSCTFLHAPRGFVDDPPGLYASSTVETLAREFPQVRTVFVDDVNHYTIVMSERGAAAIAAALSDSESQ